MSTTDDQDIDYTQSIRKQIVSAITSDGDYTKLANDDDRVKILLTTLKDMDQAALGRLRIKSDNDNVDKLIQSKAMVTDILAQFNPNQVSIDGSVNRNKRSFDEEDGNRDYVEGEMSVGISQRTFNEFVSQDE